jgi:hypothetical protein
VLTLCSSQGYLRPMNFSYFRMSVDYITYPLSWAVTHFPCQKLARYENYSLVVERSPIRGFAADCPLYKHLGFNPMPSNILFSAFAAVTLKPISSLRCSDVSFRCFPAIKVICCTAHAIQGANYTQLA